MNEMMHENTDKIDNTPIILRELTRTERNRLSRRILGKGNLKSAVEIAGVDQNTIKRAIAGFRVQPDTYNKLISLICTSPSNAESSL